MIADPSWDLWLAVLRPRLSAPLFHPEAIARLSAVAPLLPASPLACFETRLAPSAGVPAAVDLSLRLRHARPALTLAAGGGCSPALRRVLRAWAAAEWRDPLAPELWLEIDLDRAPLHGRLPDPVVCARLTPAADADFVAERLLPLLHGGPIDAPRRQAIARLARSLPAGARLHYAFSLRSRGRDRVRLEIAGLSTETCAAWLGRAEPECARLAAPWLSVLSGAERIQVSVDLEPGGSLSSPGLEGSFRRLPGREPGWDLLFDRLERAGLCGAAQRRAATAWSGHESAASAGPAWPRDRAPWPGFLVRALSHVKLAVRDDGSAEAKAYLMAQHLVKWRAPAAANAA